MTAAIDCLEQNKYDLEKEVIKREEEKKKIKERYRSIRNYTKITSIICNLIGTILLGILVGYFLEKYTENSLWMALSIIGFSLFGIVSFYISVVKFK